MKFLQKFNFYASLSGSLAKLSGHHRVSTIGGSIVLPDYDRNGMICTLVCHQRVGIAATQRGAKVTTNEEPFIMGWANLAEFLTQKGFPMAKITLSKYHTMGKGPPVHGYWSGRYKFLPSAALEWARGRERARMVPRTVVPTPPKAAPAVAADDDAPPF